MKLLVLLAHCLHELLKVMRFSRSAVLSNSVRLFADVCLAMTWATIHMRKTALASAVRYASFCLGRDELCYRQHWCNGKGVVDKFSQH